MSLKKVTNVNQVPTTDSQIQVCRSYIQLNFTQTYSIGLNHIGIVFDVYHKTSTKTKKEDIVQLSQYSSKLLLVHHRLINRVLSVPVEATKQS